MCCVCYLVVFFFFFKQKTAYEMRISDWSSDVCSSDLLGGQHRQRNADRQHAEEDDGDEGQQPQQHSLRVRRNGGAGGRYGGGLSGHQKHLDGSPDRKSTRLNSSH